MEFRKLKNTMTETKSSTDGPNSRTMGTKGRIRKLEDETMGTTQPETLKKQLREEQSLRDPWDYNKRSNICVISIPEGRKERQKKHSEKKWPKTPQIWQEWQSINSRNSDPKEKSKEIHTKTNQNEISEN